MGITLILGGQAQGKLAYALKLGSYGEQDIVSRGNFRPETFRQKPVIHNLHEIARLLLEEGTDPFPVVQSRISQNPEAIITCCEVGCGIVPMDPKEREYRETVGRLCCRIAQAADRVIRIQSGIPQILKGDAPCCPPC